MEGKSKRKPKRRLVGTTPPQGKHPYNALSAVLIRHLEPGMHCDGNGLYLQVMPSGSRSWICRTTINGKRREIGLGGLSYVSLAEAREKAIEIRKASRRGGDPLTEKREQKRLAELERSKPTFKTAAIEYHKEHSKALTNEKHINNWIGSLEKFVFPTIGAHRVDIITTADVLKVLSPIWLEIPERARRTKQRIKAVMQWAKAKGWTVGDNPVDGIEKVLPKHNREQEHFAAIPYANVPAFINSLRSDEGISGRLAFEFLILTAARTNEVIKAQWSEIDFATKTWTRPASHMKAKREHKVPLAPRCIEILKEAKKITDGGEYIFPGMRTEQPLSNMVFHATLRRMEKTGFTPHGFRSAFRDWAEEKGRGKYSQRVIETALAHVVKNKVEAAYLRTELFEERKELMAAWARFSTAATSAKVVKLRS
jgi:integrase